MTRHAMSSERLIGQIYESIGDPAALADAVQKLVAFNDSAASQFGFVDLHGRWVQASVVGVDPEGLEQYIRFHVADDPRTAFCFRHPGEFFVDAQMVGDTPAFERSALVGLLDKFECRFMVGAYFPISPGYLGAINFMRPRRHQPYGVPDLRRADSLLPHFQQAMGLHVRLGRLESNAATMEKLVDRLRTPVLLIDRLGALKYANPAGHRALQERSFLLVKGGVVRPGSPALETPFLRLLAATVSDDGRPATSMRLIDGRGGSAVLTVYSLRGMPGLKAMPQAEAVLFLSPGEGDAAAEAAGLQVLLGLTPAETRLAVQLLRGASLAEIGRSLGLARATVKSQLDALFEKTGTHRQGELAAVLRSAVAAPLR